MVDLIGLVEFGTGLAEYLDKGAATQIEIVADPVIAPHEGEGGRDAEHVAVKRLGSVQIVRENAGMGELCDQGFGHAIAPRISCCSAASLTDRNRSKTAICARTIN